MQCCIGLKAAAEKGFCLAPTYLNHEQRSRFDALDNDAYCQLIQEQIDVLTSRRADAWSSSAGKEAVEGDDSSGLKGAAVAWCSARS